MDILKKILTQYWQYKTFRGEQEMIMTAVMEQKNCLVVMPTGAGKSLCYQVPALAMEGLCIVVSPLIALMKDQVMQLKNRGITAAVLCAGMQTHEIRKVIELANSEKIKFLYVSPERIQSDFFQNALNQCKVCLIAIDEAHCISQWGYDFRPAYLQIKELRKNFPNAPLIALTATATLQVREDIAFNLELNPYRLFTQSYSRPNLSYSVFDINDKISKTIHILKKIPHSALVYCATRKQCEELSKIFLAHGINADYYHAGITHQLRNKKQEGWIQNKITVMVCTNAFGMGIDKADVRLVIHYEMPHALESYYQEAGRAGRDGKKSYVVLLHKAQDKESLYQKLEQKYPPIALIKKLYVGLNNFYKIAIGKGFNVSFDFEIEKILPLLNNMNLSTILGALDILKMLKIISIIENPKISAKIFFACNKNYLLEFQRNVPSLSPLIDYLVRHVDGVWHEASPIYLDSIAKKLKSSDAELHRKLLILEKASILHYSPAVMNPQIIFHINRIKHIEEYIDSKFIEERKKADTQRLRQMIDFAENTTLCRSQAIAIYFEDKSLDPCGICDICINSKKKKMSSNTTQKLQNDLVSLLQERAMPLQKITPRLNNYPQEDIQKMLDFLIAKKKISYNTNGDFSPLP